MRSSPINWSIIPELLDQVQKRLAAISKSNAAGRPYHEQWLELIQGPLHRLLRKIDRGFRRGESVAPKESPFFQL